MTLQKLLNELKNIGMNDVEIGREIDAAASIVQRIRKGTHRTTTYERGKKITDLAMKKLPELFN
jgi:hypothetical protein